MKKLISILLCLALVLSVSSGLFLSVNAFSGENGTYVYDFEDTGVKTGDIDYQTFNNESVHVAGWGWKIDSYGTGNVLRVNRTNPVNYYTQGAVKLYDSNGVYVLSGSTGYRVTFEMTVLSANRTFTPYTLSGSVMNPPGETATSYLKFGYGMNPTDKSTGGGLGLMSNVLGTAANVSFDAEKYTLTDDSGERQAAIGEKQTLSYTFSTPDVIDGDASIGFLARGFYGFDVIIDNVHISKMQAIKLNLMGGTGDAAASFCAEDYGKPLAIPTPERENYIFAGWHTDSSCSAPFSETVYSAALDGVWLYAQWTPVFRSVGFDYGSNNDFTNSGIYSVSDKTAYSGKNSLCFSPSKEGIHVGGNNGSAYVGRVSASFGLSNLTTETVDGVKYSCNGSKNAMEIGRYKVTFRYKVTSFSADKPLVVCIGAHQASSPNNSVWNYCSRLSQNCNIDGVTDGWQTETVILTVRLTNFNNNVFAPLVMVMPGETADDNSVYDDFIGTTVYFDQFSFEKADSFNQVVRNSFESLREGAGVDGGYGGGNCFGTGGATYDFDAANGYVLTDDETYYMSFQYKSENPVVFHLNGELISLPAAADWKTAHQAFYPKNGKAMFGFETVNGACFADEFLISETVQTGGFSVLTDDAETLAGKQAMRVYFSYRPESDGTYRLNDNYLNITERGILLADSRTLAGEMTVDNPTVKTISKTTDMENCWSYEAPVLTYSGYVTDFRKEDARYLTARGYVKTDDGTVFYSCVVRNSVSEVKRANKALALPAVTCLMTDTAVLDQTVFNCRYQNTDTGVTLDWTAASVKLTADLVGSVTYTMDITPTGSVVPSFALYVDGKLVKKGNTIITSGSVTKEYTLTVPVCDIKGVHTIELARETQVSSSPITLKSVSFHGELLDTPQKDTLIEFVGDSITSMYEGVNTYANYTARTLDTDYRVLSCGGTGIMWNSSGKTGVSKAWIDSYGIACYGRSMTDPYVCGRTADIVCVYLGTNDNHARYSGAVSYTDQDLENYIETMTEVIKSYQPDAKIVWLTGGMTFATRTAEKAVVEKLGGAQNGYYMCEFGGNYGDGTAGHPSFEQQLLMGKELTAFLTDNGLVH